MRTRIWQLLAGQYYRPSHVDIGLPLTILAAGFASGTSPNPTKTPWRSESWAKWAPYAT